MIVIWQPRRANINYSRLEALLKYEMLLHAKRQTSDQLGLRYHADKLCYRPYITSSHILTTVQITECQSLLPDLHKQSETILVNIRTTNYTNICGLEP